MLNIFFGLLANAVKCDRDISQVYLIPSSENRIISDRYYNLEFFSVFGVNTTLHPVVGAAMSILPSSFSKVLNFLPQCTRKLDCNGNTLLIQLLQNYCVAYKNICLCKTGSFYMLFFKRDVLHSFRHQFSVNLFFIYEFLSRVTALILIHILFSLQLHHLVYNCYVNNAYKI